MAKANEMTAVPGKIYAAIAGVIADVGYVAKDKVNKQQGFKFRSIDDVYNALHPALAKNKVFIVPRVLEQKREEQVTKSGTKMILVICKIQFRFYAEDGSYIETVIIGEGLDTGDKATNKAMAIAYKYACFQVFCIPTEELMDDPDGERPELKEEKKPVNKTDTQKDKRTTAKKAESVKSEQSEAKPEENPDAQITLAMLNTIRAEQKRTGVADKQILGRKAIKAKTIEALTVSEFKYVMDIFAKTPDLPGGEVNE